MLPVIELASDGQVHTTSSTIQSLAAQFKLTPADLEELLPSGRQRRFNNRVNWATTHLRKALLLESAGMASSGSRIAAGRSSPKSPSAST